MRTSKSPQDVVRVAYAAARQAMADYRHRTSPRKFTQPQLVACLVLREFLRTDYRGLAAHLADHPDLVRLLRLRSVPHFTTFQKAAVRLLQSHPARTLFEAVLASAIEHKVRRRRVPLAAVDGTGLESRHVSRYFVQRRSKTTKEPQTTTYSKYPKVVLVTDCGEEKGVRFHYSGEPKGVEIIVDRHRTVVVDIVPGSSCLGEAGRTEAMTFKLPSQ